MNVLNVTYTEKVCISQTRIILLKRLASKKIYFEMNNYHNFMWPLLLGQLEGLFPYYVIL